jgi:hypothetical protein
MMSEEFKRRFAEITSGMSLSSSLRWPFTGHENPYEPMRLRPPTTGHEIIDPDFEEQTWRRNGLCPQRQERRRCFLHAGHDGPHDFDEVNKRLNERNP